MFELGLVTFCDECSQTRLGRIAFAVIVLAIGIRIPYVTGHGNDVFGPLGSMPHQVLLAGTREEDLFIWPTSAPATCGPKGQAQARQNLYSTNDYAGLT